MFLAGAWKQLRWSSRGGQGPEDCSRRTDQQWQKPGGGRTCWVGEVDFAQRNGDVSYMKSWQNSNTRHFHTADVGVCVRVMRVWSACGWSVCRRRCRPPPDFLGN